MNYCVYYQATVSKELCWIVTSSLRFCEYVAFDRAYDPQKSIFEFFIAPDLEDVFLQAMSVLEKEGVVWNVQKMPNRLITEDV